MIAVDTNQLVYAHREDSPFHAGAMACITELTESPAAWALPWPCVHEFLAISTHPRIYTPPSPMAVAIDFINALTESPSTVLLSERAGYWPRLQKQLTAGQIIGPRVHDARIATLCLSHGVRELWTADRDFSRFPQLRCVNPLTA